MSQKLTQRAQLAAQIALQDLMHLVDVSDTSQSPQGSSYKITIMQLVGFLKLAGIGNWKSTAPTVNDDITQGYINGAFWFDEGNFKFYILNDNSAGAADWVAFDMTFIYNAGNFINGNTFIVNKNELALCQDAEANDFNNYCIGESAGKNASGATLIAIGNNAGANSSGADREFIGNNAGNGSTANSVSGIGSNAGENNTGSNAFFIGSVSGNTKSNVFAIDPNRIPSYADKAAADADLTVANGCVAGAVYLYRNEANDTIGFVIPS